MKKAIGSITSILLMFMLAAPLHASSHEDKAAQALAEAKKSIANRNFGEAIVALRTGFEAAGQILEPDTQEQALTALHFYSAVAHSGRTDLDAARSDLKEFFRLSPNSRTIDSTKYDVRFVRLFNELLPAVAQTPLSFYAVYPLIELDEPIAEPQEATWGNSPALEILGSRAEKREWSNLVDTVNRQKFINDFWRRRDPRPATPQNEFRQTFERRVAYTDRIFGSPDVRGSMSDRGRVFVLLGEPSSVRRRPLTRWDRVSVYLEPVILNGTMEQWVYGRDQLPIEMAKAKVSYRFVTQKGIGEHVLQREDVFAMKALFAAANPNENPKE